MSIISSQTGHWTFVADDSTLSKLKQILIKSQPINHKIYVVECYTEIRYLYVTISLKYFNIMGLNELIPIWNYSTYPNVVASMLERHLGNYLKKNIGEVWLNAPKTIGPIERSDGGQFKEWSNDSIEEIVGNSK